MGGGGGGGMGVSGGLLRGSVVRVGVEGTVGGTEGHEEGELGSDSGASGMEMRSLAWV